MEFHTTDKEPFLSSLRSLGYGLLTVLKNRVELISVELKEERLRLVQMLAWISAVLFFAFISIVFFSLTLVYLFWENARLQVLIGLSAFYSFGLLLIIISFRRFLKDQPSPFASSIEEMEADLTCIQPKS